MGFFAAGVLVGGALCMYYVYQDIISPSGVGPLTW